MAHINGYLSFIYEINEPKGHLAQKNNTAAIRAFFERQSYTSIVS